MGKIQSECDTLLKNKSECDIRGGGVGGLNIGSVTRHRVCGWPFIVL